eukprot:m.174387 g.174387  ORF g.174387 m.174387 type:complete len:234 (+) comp24355_c0_seq1:202-903(+)
MRVHRHGRPGQAFAGSRSDKRALACERMRRPGLVATWLLVAYAGWGVDASTAPTSTPTSAPTSHAPTTTVAPASPVPTSLAPTSRAPTAAPTFPPTALPTHLPTANPTHAPTASPTTAPTAPTPSPTGAPTLEAKNFKQTIHTNSTIAIITCLLLIIFAAGFFLFASGRFCGGRAHTVPLDVKRYTRDDDTVETTSPWVVLKEFERSTSVESETEATDVKTLLLQQNNENGYE